MGKGQLYIILSILINLTLQNPLQSEDVQPKVRMHAEEKNWKLNSGFYDNESLKNKFLDDPTTYRLPNDTLPIRYDIHLTTDVDKDNFDFHGRVRIHLRAVERTSVVTLQYRDITLTKVSLISLTNDEVLNDELNFEYIQVYEFIKIDLPRTLEVNEELRLQITYNGTLQTNGAGFYRAYYVENDRTINYALTQFESTDARHAFPCYDEPAIRTPIGLQLQHDKSYSAFSNMPLIETVPVEGTDYVVSKFDDTPPVQTYLLAFLVAPFDYVSNNDVEIPERILAKPSSIANGEAEFAKGVAGPIIKKLVNLFGVNYTLPKLDHAAITQFSAGAMENWGLITYREIYLLFSPSSNPARDEQSKRNIISIIAHEDAHQFFGNLVAPHWWSDLWMNEGFATLYEYYIPHLLYPDDGWMEEFRVYEINYCFGYDVLSRPTVPMHYYVETPRDIDNRFNSVSYSKSGVVLNMFQEALSIPTFTKGLTKYLNKMSFKAATPKDLFSSLQDAYNEDNTGNNLNIEAVMGSWVYQAGYPLVSVSRAQNKLIFEQRRYPESSGEIYSVPLSFATQKQPNFEKKTAGTWLTEEKIEIAQESFGLSDNDWIIFNVQQSGYYRVAYSSELWRAIGNGLQQNHKQIHLVNRRVLQSELTLGYRTLQNVLASDVFEVLSYLVDEEEYVVWSDAETLLKSLNTTLFGTDAYSNYQKFIRFISKKQLERVGMEAIDEEPVANRNLRNQVKTYSCYAFDEDCLAHEAQKLLFYRENEEENAVPDFCSAFRGVNAAIHGHYLYKVAEKTEVLNRARIIQSLGCSLIFSSLQLTTLVVEDKHNVLTDSERLTIIRNMMTSSPLGLEAAFHYLDRNPDKIYSLSGYLSVINTQEQSDWLDKILEAALAQEFITQDQATSMKDTVKSNLKWQETNYDAVTEWFMKFNNEPTTTTERGTTRNEDSTIITTTTTDSANGVFMSSLVLFGWILIQFLK